MLVKAVGRKKLIDSPARGSKRLKVDNARTRILTLDEQRRLMEAAPREPAKLTQPEIMQRLGWSDAQWTQAVSTSGCPTSDSAAVVGALPPHEFEVKARVACDPDLETIAIALASRQHPICVTFLTGPHVRGPSTHLCDAVGPIALRHLRRHPVWF